MKKTKVKTLEHKLLIKRPLPDIGDIVYVESVDSEMVAEVVAHDGEFHILCIGAGSRKLYEQGKVKPVSIVVNRGQLDSYEFFNNIPNEKI